MGATNLDRIANIRGKTKEIWKLFCQKLSEIRILYPETYQPKLLVINVNHSGILIQTSHTKRKRFSLH